MAFVYRLNHLDKNDTQISVANGAADTTVLFQSEFQSSTLSNSAFWVAFSQDRLTSSMGLDSGASFSKWCLLTPCASGFTIFLYILFLQLSLQGNPILLIFTPWWWVKVFCWKSSLISIYWRLPNVKAESLSGLVHLNLTGQPCPIMLLMGLYLSWRIWTERGVVLRQFTACFHSSKVS